MAHDPLALLMQVFSASLVLMVGLWLVQRRQRNTSLADFGWCLGLIGAVLWYAVMADGEPARRWLVAGMIAVHAGRLGFHVLADRIVGKQEDARYRRLRSQLGEWEEAGVFGYFLMQAGAIVLFSLPPLVVMQNPRPGWSLWELLGLLVWLAAVVGEALADRQLAAFRRKPWNADRVCREGLWRYSRHPNYFFEWLHWWSYVVMALASPLGNWWLTLLGPTVMGWALIKVTGIPPAEAQALATRGEEYRAYQRTTSAFIPWPPRRDG